MAKTTINMRVDEELKEDFEKICDDLGITMTAAFTMLAKQMVREQRIPFEITMHSKEADQANRNIGDYTHKE